MKPEGLKPETINREVAEKVMGWTIQDTKRLYWYEPAILISDWDPYHRWDQAGMVVEKLVDLGFLVRVSVSSLNAKCVLHGDRTEYLKIADTAPAAICLAALEAVKEVMRSDT